MRFTREEMLSKSKELHPIQTKLTLITMFLLLKLLKLLQLYHNSVDICHILHAALVGYMKVEHMLAITHICSNSS